jgi:hypothetical protein
MADDLFKQPILNSPYAYMAHSYMNVQHRRVSAWTVRREMNTLNAALQLAAMRRRIPYAPIVTLPPKGVARDRWLRPSEVERLKEHAAPHVRRFIEIALATGRWRHIMAS